MDKRTIAYWIITGLFCTVLGFSGLAHAGHFEDMVASMTALGYPTYFMTILGIAKLLGVVALLVPGAALLKEWAYAGFAFNLTGAFASHLFAGDPLAEAAPPVVLLTLAAASYLLRPESRRLASSPFWSAPPAAAPLREG